MAHFFFIWTDDVVEKIEQHGLDCDDVEDVVEHPENVGRSRSSDRHVAFGHTIDDRYIMVAYDMLDEMTVQPITAFEVPEP